MNLEDLLKKLLVAYGVYKGVKYLFGGIDSNAKNNTGDINSLLSDLGFKNIEDVVKLLKQSGDVVN